jgi:hypothetical protein
MSHTGFDKNIARALGLTPTGLKTLAKAIANNGRHGGRGSGYAGQGARARLEVGGFLAFDETASYSEGRYTVTEKGRQAVAAARAMGW